MRALILVALAGTSSWELARMQFKIVCLFQANLLELFLRVGNTVAYFTYLCLALRLKVLGKMACIHCVRCTGQLGSFSKN